MTLASGWLVLERISIFPLPMCTRELKAMVMKGFNATSLWLNAGTHFSGTTSARTSRRQSNRASILSTVRKTRFFIVRPKAFSLMATPLMLERVWISPSPILCEMKST